MKVIHNIPEMQHLAQEMRAAEQVLGLVPTLGALHPGHLALIHRAKQECGAVVVSIFVNPTQFGPGEDYLAYPRPLEQDLRLCEQEGVDIVFHPEVEEMFPEDFRTYVQVEALSDVLCGRFRAGHFRGVATVVLKLFNVVAPQRAYFGEKDYQQLAIIRRLARDLNVAMEIVGVPTVRDEDGLALSSRNAYLSPEERKNALSLYRALLAAKKAVDKGERRGEALEEAMEEELQKPGIVLEYAEVVDPEDLRRLSEVKGRFLAAIAARVGEARLIDNMLISEGGQIRANPR